MYLQTGSHRRSVLRQLRSPLDSDCWHILPRLRADDGIHLKRILPIHSRTRCLQPHRDKCHLPRLPHLREYLVWAASCPGPRCDNLRLQRRRCNIPYHGGSTHPHSRIWLDNADLWIPRSRAADYCQRHGPIETTTPPETISTTGFCSSPPRAAFPAYHSRDLFCILGLVPAVRVHPNSSRTVRHVGLSGIVLDPDSERSQVRISHLDIA